MGLLVTVENSRGAAVLTCQCGRRFGSDVIMEAFAEWMDHQADDHPEEDRRD